MSAVHVVLVLTDLPSGEDKETGTGEVSSLGAVPKDTVLTGGMRWALRTWC